MDKRVNRHIRKEDIEMAISTYRCSTLLVIRKKVKSTIKPHYTLN